MHLRRIIAIPIALCAAALAAAYATRNPERRDLDAAARQGASGKFITLGDGVTHYDVAGPDSGQRVMLVHGFSVPAYIWDSTVTALTGAGFRVARYDQFGRGYSDRPDVPYTADLFDRQLLQLLDSLGWRDPVSLVGLSNGGPVTAEFTARHPERVRSLTLVDPAAGPNVRPARHFRIPVLGHVLWQTLAVPTMADGQLTDFVEPAKWPDWPTRYREQMQYRGFGRALLSTLQENEGRCSTRLRAGRGVRQADAAGVGRGGQHRRDHACGRRAQGDSAGAVSSDRSRGASAAHGADGHSQSASDRVPEVELDCHSERRAEGAGGEESHLSRPRDAARDD